MASGSRILEKKLKLKVNPGEECRTPSWERKFLGFSFTSGSDPKWRIAPQASEQRVPEGITAAPPPISSP